MLAISRLESGAGLDLPRPASAGASGLDLPAAVDRPPDAGSGPSGRSCPADFSVEIPPGWEGQVRPRSGLAVQAWRDGAQRPRHCGLGLSRRAQGGARSTSVQRGLRDPSAATGSLSSCSARWSQGVEVVERASPWGDTARGEGGFGSTGT